MDLLAPVLFGVDHGAGRALVEREVHKKETRYQKALKAIQDSYAGQQAGRADLASTTRSAQVHDEQIRQAGQPEQGVVDEAQEDVVW